MTIIESTTAEQEDAIGRLAARWRSAMQRTEPVRRDGARNALVALYRYMQCEPPAAFAFYDSPQAALADFGRWRDSTGRLGVTYWPYQVPICDPTSYFRCHLKCAWVPTNAVDLRVRRSPNAHRCFAYASPIDDGPRSLVSRRLLDDVWSKIASTVGRSWCNVVNHDMLSRYEAVFDALMDEMDREAPSNPIFVDQYISLGALDWLVTEAACSEVCRESLGVPVSREHVAALSGVARECGLVYAFEKLCVVCERPERIVSDGGTLRITFRDGALAEGSR